MNSFIALPSISSRYHRPGIKYQETILEGIERDARQLELWMTPEREERLMDRQCIKRKLMPQDVANLVLFLATGDSSAITSQCHLVDGGLA